MGQSLVIDPCCGDGAILDVVADMWPNVMRRGIEIDEERASRARQRHAVSTDDALKCSAPGGCWFFESRNILVLTNPPFKLAMEFIREALRQLGPKPIGTIAMLLRLPFLASQGRADWMRANTPSVHVLPKRPEFCQSISCKRKKPKPELGWPGCPFVLVLPMDVEAPKACPTCGGKLQITTTDATDYGWFSWDAELRQPTLSILEVP